MVFVSWASQQPAARPQEKRQARSRAGEVAIMMWIWYTLFYYLEDKAHRADTSQDDVDRARSNLKFIRGSWWHGGEAALFGRRRLVFEWTSQDSCLWLDFSCNLSILLRRAGAIVALCTIIKIYNKCDSLLIRDIKGVMWCCSDSLNSKLCSYSI